VPPPAETGRDPPYVHLPLGPEIHLHASRLHLSQQEGNLDARDRPRVGDKILSFQKRPGNAPGRQGEPGNATVSTHLHLLEKSTQEPEASRGPGFIEMSSHLGRVGPAGNQIRGDPEGFRRGVRVAEGSGVGVNGGEEVGGDLSRERKPQRQDEMIHHLPGGRGDRINPVDVAVALIIRVVVNVDHPAGGTADPLQEAVGPAGVRTVREEHEVKGLLCLGPLLHERGAREEVQRVGDRGGPGHRDRASALHEGQPEAEQRSQNVSVGVDMSQEENRTPRTGEKTDKVVRDRPHRLNTPHPRTRGPLGSLWP
jgi:hypothetical protein